jgi:predicted lipoprotein with Yx(FWY)xxD motif
MRRRLLSSLFRARSVLLLTSLTLWSVASACSSDDDDDTASNETGGGGKTAGSAGKLNTAGTLHGGSPGVAGSGGSGGSHRGGSGGASSENGGSSNGGENSAGQAGMADGGAGGETVATRPECGFHTPATDNAGGQTGTGGAGGADGASVTLSTSKTIGGYLTDGDGHALYVFGADVPGDCHQPPVSSCLEGSTCAQTWTSFSAGTRALSAGLDDDDFGDFVPAPGVASESTYFGWPLYRYVGDAPQTIAGQGIATLWHAAKVPFFNVMLMKKKLSDVVTAKYISDGHGFAIYTSSSDVPASEQQTPHSSCDAACSKAWPPFTLDRFILPSSFKDSDFSLFARSGGVLQVAYRGKPLYRFLQDQKPGDTLGQAVGTFVLADPAL